jgi:hypothetical protein
MIYPNDANGDSLRRMEAEGDDLSPPKYRFHSGLLQ